MTDKAELRRRARERRAEAHGTVDPGPALAALRLMIDQTEGPVSGYWPIRTELDPRPLLTALAEDGREVCLPVTDGLAPLAFRCWRPGAPMETDGFGVSVPADDERASPAVLIVPMLAFDRAGHRLGYGAGHYDRTLSQLRADGPVTAIGLAYAVQETADPLPTLPTDQALDAIVTERETIVFPPLASSGRGA